MPARWATSVPSSVKSSPTTSSDAPECSSTYTSSSGDSRMFSGTRTADRIGTVWCISSST